MFYEMFDRSADDVNEYSDVVVVANSEQEAYQKLTALEDGTPPPDITDVQFTAYYFELHEQPSTGRLFIKLDSESVHRPKWEPFDYDYSFPNRCEMYLSTADDRYFIGNFGSDEYGGRTVQVPPNTVHIATCDGKQVQVGADVLSPFSKSAIGTELTPEEQEVVDAGPKKERIYVDTSVATVGVVQALESVELFVHDNLTGRLQSAERRHSRAVWSSSGPSGLQSPSACRKSAFYSASHHPDFDPERGLAQDHAIDGVGVLYEQCEGQPRFLLEKWEDGQGVYCSGEEALTELHPDLPDRLVKVNAESAEIRTRNKIQNRVRDAKSAGTTYSALWDRLYEEFEERHGTDLRNRSLGPIEMAECEGQLGDLLVVAQDLFA